MNKRGYFNWGVSDHPKLSVVVLKGINRHCQKCGKRLPMLTKQQSCDDCKKQTHENQLLKKRTKWKEKHKS